jgi:NifU-like protein involved in Fe-S cluster formation
MTAACREACCNVTPRRSISELFERGFRRNRLPPLAVEGTGCADAEGNTARFSLDIAEGVIAGVGFRASHCATLIAYCEFVAEIVPGFRPEIAMEMTATNLVAAVPGVPALKRERAVLAIAALRAALTAVKNPGAAQIAKPRDKISDSI